MTEMMPQVKRYRLRDFLIVLCLAVGMGCPTVLAGEIHKSAQAGDIRAVRQLLSNNPSLLASEDVNKRQPLLWAASVGSLDIVNLLLDNGADITARTPWDGTALHVASCNGHATVVDVLLKHGAKPDDIGPLGAPLHAAAYNGHTNVADVLLTNGATRSLLDKAGRSPFQVAIEERQFKYAEFLLWKGESVDIRDGQGHTCLELALGARNVAQAKFLLEHKANVNANDSLPVLLAIRSQDETLLRLVLASHPDLKVRDKDGNSPLHWAVRSPQYFCGSCGPPTEADLRRDEKVCVQMVSLLVAQPATDINAKNEAGETPLKIATTKHRANVAELLRKHGAVE